MVLLKSDLSSLLTYFLSVFQVVLLVVNQLERIQGDFLCSAV